MRITRKLLLLASGLLALELCLPAGGAEPQAPSAWETNSQGWTDIQPGAELKGWTRLPIPPTNSLGAEQWHAQAKALVCDGNKGHDMLRFDRELRDCTFHLEFRYTPATGTNHNYNSGVFIRNLADGSIWHQAQLTLDGGYLFGNTLSNGQPKRFKLPPTEARMKPAGEWNTMEVTACGKTLSVWLNGAQTCTWNECELTKGYLALEAEGFRIEFRNMKLKELPKVVMDDKL